MVKCTLWYQLTRVVHRAVKWWWWWWCLCVCFIVRRYASMVYAVVMCPSVWCECSVMVAE